MASPPPHLSPSSPLPSPLPQPALFTTIQNVANFSSPETKAHGSELVESAISAYSQLDNALLDAMQVQEGGGV